MTIYPLQVGKTYRTRDGKAEHTIISTRYGDTAVAACSQVWWLSDGRKNHSRQDPEDLVEEVRPTAPTTEGPVRRRTVTEIRPGTYGIAWVGETFDGAIGTAGFGVSSRSCSAEELDALAATATQLADALRAIAAEKEQP